MKKLGLIILSFFLLTSIYTPQAQGEMAPNFCEQYKDVKKIWWNGVELKPGQIGRLTVVKDTVLYKLDGEKKLVNRTLKAGEFYRIYAFKPGMLSVGGGYYVDRDAKVKYETPSKAKLEAVKCINNKEKVLTIQENIALNDEKVVLLSGQKAQGSGVLISKSLILTNEHVVNNNPNMTATFINGEKVNIEGVVVKDKKKDLAIVKLIRPVGIAPVKLGSSKTSLKGDTVLALGSPEGLQNSVSQGLISGFRLADGVNIIQTTASITHGSSGGGLFNNKGNLIGITTSGVEGTDLYFAVAIDEFFVWKNHLSMDHHTIPVLEYEIPQKFLIDDIHTGMTKAEVKNINKDGLLIEETEDMLTYDGITYFGYDVVEMFRFENGKLVDMAAFFIDAESFDYDTATDFFEEIYGEIAESDGNPEYIDGDWENNGYDLTLEADWKGTEDWSNLNFAVYNEKGEFVARLLMYVE